MATHRVYSNSLVGFVVLALLAALGAGGCEDSGSTGRHAIETDSRGPDLVGSPGMTYAEDDDAGTIRDEPTGDGYPTGIPMGYREPGYSDTMEAGTVTDDEYRPGRTGDMDDGSSEAMTCYGEEDASTEGMEDCGLVEEDDSTCHDAVWTPAVTEEEVALAQNNDMDDEASMNAKEAPGDEAGETSAVTDEEGASRQTDDRDEGYSGTVVPWIGGEDQTTPDPGSDDMTSDTTEAPCDAQVGEMGNDLSSEPSP